MLIKKLFLCAIGACLALTMMSVATLAQTVETRQRLVTGSEQPNDHAILEDDAIIISPASPEEATAAPAELANNVAAQYERMIYSAIDQRLGARYMWGASGPFGFDCSGFVWSTFKSAGVDFGRSSARSLWTRFAPAAPEEHFKFGTLVFFSRLRHIGIVADENGFYHASRTHGVVYSPFNNYWVSRIDGFRRVPLPESIQIAQALD